MRIYSVLTTLAIVWVTCCTASAHSQTRTETRALKCRGSCGRAPKCRGSATDSLEPCPNLRLFNVSRSASFC